MIVNRFLHDQGPKSSKKSEADDTNQASKKNVFIGLNIMQQSFEQSDIKNLLFLLTHLIIFCDMFWILNLMQI